MKSKNKTETHIEMDSNGSARNTECDNFGGKKDPSFRSRPIGTELKAAAYLFAKTTSVKGISQATKSDSLFLQILWISGTLIGLGSAFYLVCTITLAYFQYETVIQIEKCVDCKPAFPDITFCNLNILATLADSGILNYQEYVSLIDTLLFSNSTGDFNSLSLEEQVRLLHMYSTSAYFDNIDSDEVWDYLRSTDGANVFVHGCEWFDWSNNAVKEPSCRESRFQVGDGMDLFVCFTINTHAYIADRASALSTILYLHDFHELRIPYYAPLYNTNIRAARGARIFIHEPGILPDINKGFDIAPGHDVKIDLNMEVIKRVNEPYGKCTNERYLDDIDKVPEDEFRYKYSTDAAVARCQQLHTIHTCNCTHPFLPITPEVYWDHIFKRGIVSCYTHLGRNHSLEEIEAAIRCFNSVSFEKACNDLLSPCKETVYFHQSFQTPWPHETYEMSFYEDVIKAHDDIRTEKFEDRFSVYDAIETVLYQNQSEGLRLLRDETLIERNFIQLKATFQSKGIVYQQTRPAVPYENVIGSYGGILNLWIGITFFTLLEVIELFYHCCCVYLGHLNIIRQNNR